MWLLQRTSVSAAYIFIFSLSLRRFMILELQPPTSGPVFVTGHRAACPLLCCVRIWYKWITYITQGYFIDNIKIILLPRRQWNNRATNVLYRVYSPLTLASPHHEKKQNWTGGDRALHLNQARGHFNWRMGLPVLLGGNLGCRIVLFPLILHSLWGVS